MLHLEVIEVAVVRMLQVPFRKRDHYRVLPLGLDGPDAVDGGAERGRVLPPRIRDVPRPDEGLKLQGAASSPSLLSLTRW